MDFEIHKTWDSKPINHDPVKIRLIDTGFNIIMEIKAPFFNDPAPQTSHVGAFDKLWEYEVVEAFFLGKDERYLEVEFSPHKHHLVLLLDGRKNAVKKCLPLTYVAEINGEKWHGVAEIPKEYFPPDVNKFNAYAIHGTNENRTYEALYPVPEGQFDYPDFHRLEYFQQIDFSDYLPYIPGFSEVWLEALQKSEKEEKLECSS